MTIANACLLGVCVLLADAPALKLRASGIGAAAAASPMTIELVRWSTDVERASLMKALSAPPPPPPTPVGPGPAGTSAAGRGLRGRGPAPPPPSPLMRLTAAIKSAPTVGFIWGDGPTGFSIKYAWRAAASDGRERIVLVTDRRIGANSTSWPAAKGAAADADFTVLEMRIDGKGGEAKLSLTAPVVVDTAANTLALDASVDAPALLKVTR